MEIANLIDGTRVVLMGDGFAIAYHGMSRKFYGPSFAPFLVVHVGKAFRDSISNDFA